MKISRITKLTAIFLIVFLLLAVAAFVAGRPDLRYRISEALRSENSGVLPTETKVEILKKYTYCELKTDKRVILSDSLMLINEQYRLPDGYSLKLVPYGEVNHRLNVEAVEAFRNLSKAVEESCAENLLIVSAYRNAQEQKRTIAEEGEKAADVDASEHLTGLAMDICIKNYGGNAFLKSRAGRFVNSYCYDYGFIIRYPMFKKNITGIGYEPWHIRYVGLPHSKIIGRAKITLEEYIDYLKEDKFYRFKNLIITRQKKGELRLPLSFKKAVICDDNTGCYIISLEI